MENNLNKEENKRSEVDGVSGSISVSQGRTDRYRCIYSNSNWFNGCEYFVVKDDGKCLSIRKCGLEVPKAAQKWCRMDSGGYFQCVSELPLSQFEFDDEESTEDEVRIYYR